MLPNHDEPALASEPTDEEVHALKATAHGAAVVAHQQPVRVGDDFSIGHAVRVSWQGVNLLEGLREVTRKRRCILWGHGGHEIRLFEHVRIHLPRAMPFDINADLF
jgi:hypothetical protein